MRTITSFKYSYFNRIVDIWNSLPYTVRQVLCISIFKSDTKLSPGILAMVL